MASSLFVLHIPGGMARLSWPGDRLHAEMVCSPIQIRTKAQTPLHVFRFAVVHKKRRGRVVLLLCWSQVRHPNHYKPH